MKWLEYNARRIPHKVCVCQKMTSGTFRMFIKNLCDPRLDLNRPIQFIFESESKSQLILFKFLLNFPL